MKKKFNITGTCVPHLHYMVNVENKVKKVIELVEEGLYFVISRPRQYGKTSLIYALEKKLEDKYVIISTSFEGLGDSKFQDTETFCSTIFETLAEGLYNATDEEKEKVRVHGTGLKTLEDVSKAITKFTKGCSKKVVLIIDEVDRASNFNLFISFLGMLRDKYLKRNSGKEHTFHSVILAGLHDIKNIKLKMRPDTDSQYNSPWNIATEFDVDMSFSPKEIETMLVDYASTSLSNHQTQSEKGKTQSEQTTNNPPFKIKNSKPVPSEVEVFKIQLDIPFLSKEIYKYTSGYPFLVSKICKLIDEKLNRDWSISGIKNAINLLINEQNTLFDDMVKNIESRSELYQLIKNILLNEETIEFNQYNPVINIGAMYGILNKNEKNKLIVGNKVFEIFLYNYITSKLEVASYLRNHNSYESNYLDEDGELDMEKTLLKFQEFIKSTYSDKNIEFYERHGRLLLIAFMKPIINGSGFYYLESQHSYERRSDMIITFNKKEYILELKLWYGKKYHEEGLKQLAGYLESRNHKTGYLVAFNFNKNKEFSYKWNEVNGKKIFEVLV